MQGKWVLLCAAAVIAGVGAGALSLRKRSPAPAATVPQHPTAVAANEVTLSGKIRPQHVTSVAPDVTGFIEAFLVDVGQEVYQGQVLARIGAQGLESAREMATSAVEHAQEAVNQAESAVTSARLENSRAEADAQRAQLALEHTEKNFSRQRTLFAEGATPRLTYEKAEHEYESAKQELEIMNTAVRASRDRIQNALDGVGASKKILVDKSQQAEEAQSQLEAAEVRSPVEGLVVDRKGEIGKSAEESGTGLFQIATDLFALEMTVEPPPDVLKRLRPGQQALVLILDLQSAGIPGTIREIRENQAIIEFNSAVPAVKPGMQADVRLKLD